MSVLSLIFLATSLQAVDCAQQRLADRPQALHAFEEWPQVVCAQFENQFGRLELSKLSARQPYYGTSAAANSSEASGQRSGKFTFEGVKAGRLKVHWTDGSDSSKTAMLWLKVAAYRTTWVAKRALVKGQQIRAGDVEFRNVNVAPFLGIKEPIPLSPVGGFADRSLAKGKIITRDIITTPPLIEKNTSVDIILQRGAISLTQQGIALQSSWARGDKVQVRMRNRHTVTTRVKAKGVVEIHE